MHTGLLDTCFSPKGDFGKSCKGATISLKTFNPSLGDSQPPELTEAVINRTANCSPLCRYNIRQSSRYLKQ